LVIVPTTIRVFYPANFPIYLYPASYKLVMLHFFFAKDTISWGENEGKIFTLAEREEGREASNNFMVFLLHCT